MSSVFIVELEPGVWLEDGYGDPPRAVVERNAKRFCDRDSAVVALMKARRYRQFRNAEIVEKK